MAEHDRLSPEELSEIETATGPVAGYALRELVRVYRAATADAGLAARMHREGRIVTLEAKNAAMLDELERLRPVVAAAEAFARAQHQWDTAYLPDDSAEHYLWFKARDELLAAVRAKAVADAG